MQKPLVSIIMPVYNMGEHLRKSVPSVLNQTYENIELILVDDGSKDNSLEVCRELAVKDNRIKVFHQDLSLIHILPQTGNILNIKLRII